MVVRVGGGLAGSARDLGAVGPLMIDPRKLAEWVESSCSAQGVPVLVADSGIVSQVADLLGAGVPAAAPAGARRDAAPTGSTRD